MMHHQGYKNMTVDLLRFSIVILPVQRHPHRLPPVPIRTVPMSRPACRTTSVNSFPFPNSTICSRSFPTISEAVDYISWKRWKSNPQGILIQPMFYFTFDATLFGARRFDAQHGTVRTPDPVRQMAGPSVFTRIPIRHTTCNRWDSPIRRPFRSWVPVDTTYLGLPAIIDSINVTGVTGLPSGFSYSAIPATGFPGGSNGCSV